MIKSQQAFNVKKCPSCNTMVDYIESEIKKLWGGVTGEKAPTATSNKTPVTTPAGTKPPQTGGPNP